MRTFIYWLIVIAIMLGSKLLSEYSSGNAWLFGWIGGMIAAMVLEAKNRRY